MAVGNNVLLDSISLLDISDDATIAPFLDVLDLHSKALAADGQLRRSIGNGVPNIWPGLNRLWKDLAAAHSTIEDDEDEGDSTATLRSLCVSVARFTRNLVAAELENQSRAFENEPSIREILRYYTSYAVATKPESLPATRILTQALSNMVTANEGLLEEIWNLYLQQAEEQLILIRLLAIPDPGTTIASFVFILNCVHGNKERMAFLTNGRSGPRLCITYLDRVASLFDAADENSLRAFELGYELFRHWADAGIVPAVYVRIGIPEEVVTPHQTTLLKLLDAYLQPPNVGGPSNLHLLGLCDMCTTTFFTLTSYTQRSIRRALGSDNSRSSSTHLASLHASAPDTYLPVHVNDPPSNEPLEELDLLLPKICEALVLVTQCLISLALLSEEMLNATDPKQQANKWPSSSTDVRFKDYLNNAVSQEAARSIETLIETLRLLDQFLPRITFGKVAHAPVYVGESNIPSSDESAGKKNGYSHPQASDPKGFSYLKRDLVRLLGILAADCPDVQNRVRGCGGINVVLNLCVIDDRNPYLREHALFTLRNLLHGNLENQAVVNEVRPLREWTEPVA
ncbi:spinocerebellar ataxia type 10 protein domain-containing protein [Cytidiella melzeri]|nr:spinocerebellar ataxia type 10 protein domain-containing protein [Cytidiella melzeri]